MGIFIEDEKTCFLFKEETLAKCKGVGCIRFKRLEPLKLPCACLSAAATKAVHAGGNGCLNNELCEGFCVPGTTVFHCAYHRIIGWKRPLRSSSSTVTPTPPCLLNHVPKCPSRHFLNTSRDGDSTTSLGSLFQCLTTLPVKKFFLISNLNLP